MKKILLAIFASFIISFTIFVVLMQTFHDQQDEKLFEDENFILNRYNRFNAYDIKTNLIAFLEDGIEHFCD